MADNDTRFDWILGNQAQRAVDCFTLIIYKVTIRMISRYLLSSQ